MNKIDYKIFVPRGENNYVRFDNEKEFEIDDFKAVNIYIADDKVVYFFYIKIPSYDNEDQHHKLLLRKGKKPKLTLLIGNNPYEIIGECEVLDTSYNNWEEKIEIKISFIVINASKTLSNERKEVKYERSELLDLRDD